MCPPAKNCGAEMTKAEQHKRAVEAAKTIRARLAELGYRTTGRRALKHASVAVGLDHVVHVNVNMRMRVPYDVLLKVTADIDGALVRLPPESDFEYKAPPLVWDDPWFWK